MTVLNIEKVAFLVLLSATACEDPPAPTVADVKAVVSAQAGKVKAQAAKDDADKALLAATKKADGAAKTLDDATDKAKAAADKLGDDWDGPEREFWGKTWTDFDGTKEKTLEKGEWVIERTEKGVTTAWRKVKDASKKTGEKIVDAGVLTNVKTKLAIDDEIKARNIDVDVKDGVVELKGTVESAAQAGEAIRIALGTRGVEKVVSRLTWK